MSYKAFSLYFRRYAPFETFGYVPLWGGGGRSEGDGRKAASTSLRVTARVTGAVIFDETKVLSTLGYAGRTLMHPLVGDTTKTARVASTLIRPTICAPMTVAFEASTAASQPLVVFSPDINTIVRARINFAAKGQMTINGEVFGDNFPNLEVFLICWRTGRTALLLDGRTTGGRDSGPAARLFREHDGHLLGRLRADLALGQDGGLARNYPSVAATTLPDY